MTEAVQSYMQGTDLDKALAAAQSQAESAIR